MGGNQSQTVNASPSRNVERLPLVGRYMDPVRPPCEIEPPTKGNTVRVYPVFVHLDENSQMHLWEFQGEASSAGDLSSLYFDFKQENLKQNSGTGTNSICRVIAHVFTNIFHMCSANSNYVSMEDTGDTSIYREFQRTLKTGYTDNKETQPKGFIKSLLSIPHGVTKFVVHDLTAHDTEQREVQYNAIKKNRKSYTDSVSRLWNVTKLSNLTKLSPDNDNDNKDDKVDIYTIVLQVDETEIAHITLVALLAFLAQNNKEEYEKAMEKNNEGQSRTLEFLGKQMEELRKRGKFGNAAVVEEERQTHDNSPQSRLIDKSYDPFIKQYVDVQNDRIFNCDRFGDSGFVGYRSVGWEDAFRRINSESSQFDLFKSAIIGYEKHIQSVYRQMKGNKLAQGIAAAPEGNRVSRFVQSIVPATPKLSYVKRVAKTTSNIWTGRLGGSYKSKLFQYMLPAGVAAAGAFGLYNFMKSETGNQIKDKFSNLLGVAKKKSGLFMRGEVIQAMPKLENAKTKLEEIMEKISKTHKGRGKKTEIKELEELEKVVAALDDVMVVFSSVLRVGSPLSGSGSGSDDDLDISESDDEDNNDNIFER